MALPKVAVKANPRYGNKLWPVGSKHIDIFKESYQEVRHQDPFSSFDCKKRNGDFAQKPPAGKTIEPWKALVIYSTEPNQYMDYDLILHKNQKITGGSHGWRHMYFTLFGTTYGSAVQSFRVHRDLARLAFENGHDYWGWRYLSRCIHYLTDLGQPFHVKAFPGSFMIKKVFSRHELFKTVSAIHQSYEVYVERRFRAGFSPFSEALMQGARESLKTALSPDALLNDYIKMARMKHDPIFYHFIDQFGPELLKVFSNADQNMQLDPAVQTRHCSGDAARIIFKESNLSKLDDLDGVTVEILAGVGRLLSALLKEFLPDTP